MCFSCFCHSKYHKSFTPSLQCDFFEDVNFSYGHLFLVSVFYQLTSEKSQVHNGGLTHCKQTLQLIKFYLIKNMKGNRGNCLAQFKFPSEVFCDCFFYHMVKFTVSLIPLSPVHNNNKIIIIIIIIMYFYSAFY